MDSRKLQRDQKTPYFSVSRSFTLAGSFDARVFGYMKGESVSTSSRSSGMTWSLSIFLTPSSDLSFHRYPTNPGKVV